MTIKQMKDEIIRSRGFEDKMTIWFFTLCADKTLAKSAIENAFIAAITASIGDDEDEEF